MQAEKTLIQENPLKLVSKEYLSIKLKRLGSPIVKLRLNTPQQLLYDVIAPLIKAEKAIRLLLLKSRQEGGSTFIESLIYAYTSQVENVNSLIIADIAEHTNNLFEMSKLFHEKLSAEKPHLAPALKKSNEKKLEFEGIHSQIIVASAENVTAATSHTFQLAHVSEASKFRKLKELLNDLSQTVPKTGLSMIILETTANGMEAFYDLWIEALNGNNEWICVFLPWFLMDDYAMPLQDGKLYPIESIKFDTNNSRNSFLQEEDRLRKEEQLSEEQLNWRRWSIVNDSGGDINVFNQENPSSWQVAFQMSGSTFFDTNGLERQRKKKPIDIGEIHEISSKFEFRSLPHGRIKIYQRPVQFEQYIITLDASEALGQDEASALVLNKRLNEVVAVANGQYTPEELGHLGIMLSNYYNKGLCAPENKGYGYHLCQTIYAKYGNIYRRITTKDGVQEESEEIGFNTNAVTRPEMLSRAAEVIRVSACTLNDADLISQCQTFIINPKTKKAEAAPNKQDGLVITFSIAQQMRHLFPYVPPKTLNASQARMYQEATKHTNAGFRF